MLAEARPFPSELTTPPVTKRYFVFLERMGIFHVPRTGRGVNVMGAPLAQRNAMLEATAVLSRHVPSGARCASPGLTETITEPSAWATRP